MNGQIFISYRRDDSKDFAGRIYDRLTSRFPPSQIFMDVDSIGPGVDFVEALEESVASCDVLIAVIGKRWLASVDQQGNRRLDKTDDFVRLEIATALRRNILVIPVLHDDASMPQSGDLPEDLRPLAHRNALEMSHTRFSADLAHLIGALERALEKADGERKHREEQERLALKADFSQVREVPVPTRQPQPEPSPTVSVRPSEVAATVASPQPAPKEPSVSGAFGLMLPGFLGNSPLRRTHTSVSLWFQWIIMVVGIASSAVIAVLTFTDPHANRGFVVPLIASFLIVCAVEALRSKLSLAKAARIEPKHAVQFSDLGKIHFLQSKPAEALSDYSTAIGLNPDLAYAWLGRGIVCCYMGRLDESIKDFSEAIRLMPEPTDAYNNRGVAYAQSKRFQEAIEDFSVVIHLKPYHAVAYRNRAYAYQRVGNLSAARHDDSKARQLFDRSGKWIDRGK